MTLDKCDIPVLRFVTSRFVATGSSRETACGLFVCKEGNMEMRKKTEEVLDANGLTPEQEMYCRARLVGQTPPQAYRDAYPEKSENTSYTASKKLEEFSRIRERIQALRDMTEEQLVAGCDEIKAVLSQILLDESRPDGVRLKAGDQLTRMLGGYNDKLEVSGEFGVQEKRDALSDLLDG